jgi:hypothetical protein
MRRVLEIAASRGVHVWAVDDRIRFSDMAAPAEVVEALRRHKTELLRLLTVPITPTASGSLPPARSPRDLAPQLEDRRPAAVCPGSTAGDLDAHREAFRQEYDAYVCRRCGEPVLLEAVGKGRKRYIDCSTGRPHYEVLWSQAGRRYSTMTTIFPFSPEENSSRERCVDTGAHGQIRRGRGTNRHLQEVARGPTYRCPWHSSIPTLIVDPHRKANRWH